tara:strand:- start:1575 stop:2264 length:690 start_codon:yes stop_codon:yes gene_type:complete
MGYLNNSTTVLDAILTKKGRELLSRGVNEFAVTKFALADDEVDYALWDVSHPLGTDYYGTVIENTPLLEPTPNANTTMKYKLVTRPSGTTNMSTIINVNSSYEVIYDAALGQPVGSQTVTPSSTNLPNGNVDPNGYSFTLLNSSIAFLTSPNNDGGASNTGGINYVESTQNISQTVFGNSCTIAAKAVVAPPEGVTYTTTLVVTGLSFGATIASTVTVTYQSSVGQTNL